MSPSGIQTTGVPIRPSGRMGIGEVIRQLHDEFPDITVSKIRFLETEGLVEPERTPSGYRKFTADDLERLRYVLRAQRDHYLPLKVIREHLDAMARGLEPPAYAGASPRVPTVPRSVTQSEPQSLSHAAAQSVPLSPGESGGPPQAVAPQLRLSRSELLANSGLTEAQLAELEGFGLVRPGTGTEEYDATSLAVAGTAAEMAAFGLEPRHLRTFKTAADREVGLIDQVIAPVARQRDEGAAARAAAMRDDLAELAARLHAALVHRALNASR